MWEIDITRLRGFCPKYFEDTYPSFGNKAQAGAMQNISLVDPNVMTQGSGMAELTNGDQGGAVTTLIRGILRQVTSSGVSFAIGGNKLYKFSSDTVNSGGTPSWPRTISDDGSEVGEDVAYYQGALYYSYNQAGSIGTIGRYNLDATFDDDYWDTGTPAASDLQSAPHQMINGGDDVLYIANGRYIATLDGTTGNDQGLDFWQNSEISSITWNYNRVLAALNRPNVSGVNVNQSAIYRWDGFSSSWEGDPVEVSGRIGALYTKNGITYVWYESFLTGTARLTFGYINGVNVVPLRTFSGTLPAYYQVGEMSDYIIWLSSGRLYAYGPLSGEVESDMFQMMSPQYTTATGGIANPFGRILIASNASTNYSLERESGYAVSANYKTLLFNTNPKSKSEVREIIVEFNTLATGARVDLTLKDNKGTSLWTGIISYAGDGAVTKKTFRPGAQGENFRLEYDFTNGSATNPVEIRKTYINGLNVDF